MFLWRDHKLDEVSGNWPLLNENLAGIIERYPRTEDNESAKELKRLYSEIEYVLGESGHSGDNALQRSIRSYSREQFEKVNESVAQPAKELRQFFYFNEIVLDGVERVLLDSPEPVFWFNPTLNIYEAVPYEPYATHLQEMLIAKSLFDKMRGENDKAWNTLLAAAKIADSFFKSPDLLSQMKGLKAAGDVLLAMRKMPTPVPEWAFQWPNNKFEYGLLNVI